MKIIEFIILLLIIIIPVAIITFRFMVKRFLTRQEERVERNNLIMSLCLQDKQRIPINNADDLLKYVTHIHPTFDQTADVIRKTISIRGEFNYKVKFSPENDGKYSWWQFCYIVAKDTNVTGFIIDETDEFEDKRLKKETKRNAIEAKKQDHHMETLSATLRQPLNSICDCCNKLANSDNISTEEKTELSNTITKHNNFLIQQISDILLFSRIASGRQQYVIEHTDVTKIMTEIYNSELDFVSSNIKFMLELGRPNIFIDVDYKRVIDIFSQYFLNAIKFTSKGFIAIGWQYHLDSQLCELYMEDSGIGLSSEKQSAIFGMFSKTHEFAKDLGLGLNIAKSLAEAMGGYITVDSREGKGSRFSAWFKAEALPITHNS